MIPTQRIMDKFPDLRKLALPTERGTPKKSCVTGPASCKSVRENAKKRLKYTPKRT
jgi:hypothetical protein